MNLTSLPPALVRASTRALMRLPRPILAALGGARGRVTIDGQRLDPQIAAILAMNDLVGPPPIERGDPASARLLMARGFAPFGETPRPMAAAHDLAVDSRPGPRPGSSHGHVPARLYRPRQAQARGPAVIYVHGGGGMVGSVDVYDSVCRLIADDTGMVVISVEYRLAPEHPFPAGFEDTLAAYAWVREHAATLDVDPDRLAVAGDSMGGNFTAALCQHARDHDLPMPALQVLLYPGLDATLSSPSQQTFAHGYFLTASTVRWFLAHYLAHEDHRWDVRASPLFAARLHGLPPALIVTAGHDPLRDDGRLYAERLERAGVTVRYRCETGLIHGYVSLTGVIAEARRAVARMNADIRALLAPTR
jgi:acetyl esterase